MPPTADRPRSDRDADVTTADADGATADAPEEPGAVGPEGKIDFGWVMQTTFVLTILAGVPLVVLLSLGVTLPTWESWVSFAVRVGAVVWFCTAVAVYLYARRRAGVGQST